MTTVPRSSCRLTREAATAKIDVEGMASTNRDHADVVPIRSPGMSTRSNASAPVTPTAAMTTICASPSRPRPMTFRRAAATGASWPAAARRLAGLLLDHALRDELAEQDQQRIEDADADDRGPATTLAVLVGVGSSAVTVSSGTSRPAIPAAESCSARDSWSTAPWATACN